jgi:beta-glucosidase
MPINRRTLLTSGSSLLAARVLAKASPGAAGNGAFPNGFLWGAATAGHQIEGNNTSSDIWLLENVKPTMFAEPSGDACNSFELWATDLDLVKGLGLNSYRFSIEWARIEPEPGLFSIAMLDHYARIIDGCRERGLTPIVTYNHFVCPKWFAASGGWVNPKSPDWFARYCERATRHLGAGIGYATTFNEPNIMRLLRWFGLPPNFFDTQDAMLKAAARAAGSERFVAANATNFEDLDAQLRIMIAAHKAGRAAIKSVRPDLPVGVSLAMVDDQAVGKHSKRDAKRAEVYGAWLEAARDDDFIGVQNYDRSRIDANGPLPPPEGTPRNYIGAEVYPPSLGGAVRYAHAETGRPIIVTENGVGTDDDSLRARYIPEVLAGLKAAIDDGVPVRGYMHWSLLDNFEWVFGYKPKFGLFSVDRTSFRRTAKPSSDVLARITRRNAL